MRRHTRAGETVQFAGLWKNLVWAILGNIAGVSVLVALVYYVIYRRPAVIAPK